MHYDIDTKTRHTIENNKVLNVETFSLCPYVWCGELKRKIEAGLIKWVCWKQWRDKDIPIASDMRPVTG